MNSELVRIYNENALAMAEKFDAIGVRLADIEETLALVKSNPKVLEIGCGNGRDAFEICKRTNDYFGIDASEKLIELARKKVPQARFEVADVEQYAFPKGLDIVFSFASLVHTPRDISGKIFNQIFEALNPGGVFRLSLKSSDRYAEVSKEDEFGIRTYYLYTEQDIKDLGKRFEIVKMQTCELRGQAWLEALFQKTT